MAEQKIITGGKPDPDPTLLTTQALLREIGSLKELFDARFSSVEKAVALIHQALDNVHVVIDEKVTHLKDLTDEKFAGIATRFAEARYLTEQTSRNDKLALDAALQAQKEDVGKQNDSNNASISKTEVLFTKQIDGLNDKIDDIKSRFIANDSQLRGKSEGIGMVGALIIGASFVIATVISVAAFVVNFGHSHLQP
jgi:hypothetical protein